jgi:hypothetical protein
LLAQQSNESHHSPHTLGDVGGGSRHAICLSAPRGNGEKSQRDPSCLDPEWRRALPLLPRFGQGRMCAAAPGPLAKLIDATAMPRNELRNPAPRAQTRCQCVSEERYCAGFCPSMRNPLPEALILLPLGVTTESQAPSSCCSGSLGSSGIARPSFLAIAVLRLGPGPPASNESSTSGVTRARAFRA